GVFPTGEILPVGDGLIEVPATFGLVLFVLAGLLARGEILDRAELLLDFGDPFEALLDFGHLPPESGFRRRDALLVGLRLVGELGLERLPSLRLGRCCGWGGRGGVAARCGRSLPRTRGLTAPVLVLPYPAFALLELILRPTELALQAVVI